MFEEFDLQMLNVGYDEKGEAWNWENVSSPFVRIYLVDRGNAWLKFDDEKIIELKQGHLYIIPPFTNHTCVGNEGFVHYYIHLYGDTGRISSLFDEFVISKEVKAQTGDREIFDMLTKVFPGSRLVSSNPSDYDNAAGLRTFIAKFEERPPCEKMLSKGAMLVLLMRFLSGSGTLKRRLDSRITNVVNYISGHMSADISIKTLADIAFMSESYFIRKFKSEIGLTPIQFINKRRIENAQYRLLISTVSVKDIGYSVGFTDQSHFLHTFKKYTGVTPNEYRLGRLQTTADDKSRKKGKNDSQPWNPI